MGWWFGRKSAPADAGPFVPAWLSTDSAEEGFARSYSEQFEEVYRRNPVGQRSVRLVAGMLGSLTIDGDERAVGLVSQTGLLEAITANLLLHGNPMQPRAGARDWTRGVAVLTGDLNGVRAYGGGVTADGSIKAYGTFYSFGPQSGAVGDQTLFLDTTNSNITCRGRRWASGVASDIGTIMYTYGFGMFYDTANATWAHTFRINGASTVAIKSTGVDLQAGKILSLSGTPLVGPRKTGWALDTGTAKRTANATYSGAAEATYTQATIQALMDAVRDLSQSMKALKDDLHGTGGHGLIGT